MNLRLGSVLALLLASSLPACDSEPKLTGSQRFANEHESELRAFRTQLTAVATAAAAAAPLEKDGFTEAAKLDTSEYDVVTKVKGGNARILQLATLQDANANPKVRVGGGAKELRGLDNWLADTSALPPGSAEMERLLALEYVFVVSVLRAEAPKQAGPKSFTGGGVAADARLYRLADGADLGGVRFGSLSSASINVRGAAATSQGLDRDISLRSDLSVQANRALGRALKAAMPDIVLDPRFQPLEPAE